MKKRTQFHIIVNTFLFAALFETVTFAQFGPSNGPSTGALANQVPLSGRTGESGSVSATQSPVAGTTNSVNTINPSIQTAGPYTGSSLSVLRYRSPGNFL